MKQNVGSLDRTVRLSLGAVLAVVGIVGYVGFVPLAWIGIGQALGSIVVLLLGLILLVTGALRTCPIYMALGLSSVGDSTETEEAGGERPA